MCKVGGALLVAVLACVGAARGQDTLVARLRARADSLVREWRQASAFADVVDSLERQRAGAGHDTIAVGALRIVTNASPLPVRAAAERAWPAIDSLYGSLAADLAGRPYIIHAVDPDTAVRQPSFHVGLVVPWDLDEGSLVTVLLTNVPIAPVDPVLADWLGAPLRPAVRAAQDRGSVYVQLVTAPSEAARACLLAGGSRCQDALGLGDVATLLQRWYPSAAERRALVTRTFGDYFNQGGTKAPFQACAAGGDADCAGLLRTLPVGALPKPLGNDARTTLTHLALQVGGRDAYRRLLANPNAPIADRLGVAAGTPIDSLVARWRAQVIAARPNTVFLPGWAFAVALGWTAFFAVCGLRSSRWRVT